MKRRLVLLLLLLVGGAIVNVPVASIAIRHTPASAYQRSEDGVHWILNQYNKMAPPTFPMIDQSCEATSIQRRRSAWCAESVSTQYMVSNRESVRYVCFATGWPRHAFQSEFWEHVLLGNAATRFERGMWPRGDFSRGYKLFFWPLWPGFAINTVFYAAILWGLFVAPFVLRRWRRIKRGLCPKCAYDLRGSESEQCPECGAAVASACKAVQA